VTSLSVIVTSLLQIFAPVTVLAILSNTDICTLDPTDQFPFQHFALQQAGEPGFAPRKGRDKKRGQRASAGREGPSRGGGSPGRPQSSLPTHADRYEQLSRPPEPWSCAEVALTRFNGCQPPAPEQRPAATAPGERPRPQGGVSLPRAPPPRLGPRPPASDPAPPPPVTAKGSEVTAGRRGVAQVT